MHIVNIMVFLCTYVLPLLCNCTVSVHASQNVVIHFLGARPTLPELLRLDVPQQVGANYSIFGILLLNDETGSRVRSFKKECLGDAEDVVLRILQEWLEGKGVAVTWELLVKTLKEAKLCTLARSIQEAKL